MLNIVVFIKQVPDTTDITWTDNNTIDRQNVESVINPKDLYAIETALRIAENQETNITVVTMGPPQAESVLKTALAMGIDKAVLLSDKKFSGADTVATSRVLSKFIREKAPETDLLLFGQVANDGETGQTGPSVAEYLWRPCITNVKQILKFEDNRVLVKRDVDDGVECMSADFPAVLCINDCDYVPRMPRINGYIHSQQVKCDIFSMYDLNLTEDEVGIKGSPTFVKKVYKPEIDRQGEILTPESSEQVAKMLFDKINTYMEQK